MSKIDIDILTEKLNRLEHEVQRLKNLLDRQSQVIETSELRIRRCGTDTVAGTIRSNDAGIHIVGETAVTGTVTAKLAPNQIRSLHLVNGAVTEDKLAEGVRQKLDEAQNPADKAVSKRPNS